MNLSINCSLILIFSLLIIRCQAQSNSSISAERASQIDSLFQDWNGTDTPGGAVMIMKGGKLIYSKGYGMADLEFAIPNTSNKTKFHIASVTKQITAFAIHLLAADGKLSLDDDIKKYIKHMPDYGHQVNLRHLMTHTSGIPEEIHLLMVAGVRMDDIVTQPHILKTIKAHDKLNFNPGNDHSYCNSGYSLLASVVEKVSGMSFSEFVHARILDPLGMKNSVLADDYQQIIPNRAYSYLQSDDEAFKKGISNYFSYGPHGLYTTPDDFAKWAANFNNPIVGSREIFDEMEKVAILNDGNETTAAHGQFLGHYDSKKNFWHQGLDIGFGTYFLRFPENDLAVAAFTNVDAAPVVQLALKTVDLIWDDYFPKEEEKEKIKDPSVKKADGTKEELKFVDLSEKELQLFCGKYWTENGYFSREISLKNDTLFYVRSNGNSTALKPTSNSELVMMINSRPRLKFKKNESGTLDFKFESNGWNGEFIRKQSSKNIMEKSGRYFSRSLGTSFYFSFMDGQLTAQHARIENLKFEAITEDVFYCDEFYIGQIKFLRDNKGQVNGMQMDNSGFHNLYFERLD